jgi:HK97 family phage prohead protease
VFGNVDTVGDRIEKGAFTRTLAEKGLPPIVWSHEWQVPPIGVVESAAETDEGLQIKGRLFVDPVEDHAIAKQVYAAMRAKDGNGQPPLREFSFGYSVRESAEETVDGETVRVLKDLELFEVGPTLAGMNPETRLVGVKALESAVAAQIALEGKTGRVLSKANETKLRDAHSLITEVISMVDEEPKTSSAAAAAEKKDSPQDKEPTKEPDEGDEESATRIAAVLLARPDVLINQED